jgi:YYY domain-containing protein
MNRSSSANQEETVSKSVPRKKKNDFIWEVLLLIILVLGAYFRFTGLNWDNNQHLHPDERFLTMVASSIKPVESIGEYFDTAQSSLNPNNRGYGFYVYGTLPLFIVRGIADALSQTGYDEIFLVGRALSGLFDLLTVFLVYLIVIRLYKKPLMALLAAALTAGSVMQIQLSHYFAVDTFTTFFTTGVVYFSIRILTQKDKPTIPAWIGLESEDAAGADSGFWQKLIARLSSINGWDGIGDVLLSGLFLGCAMASKINAGLVALLIPAAYLIRYLNLPEDRREAVVYVFIRNVVIAAAVCILTFRIFQPYAFTGPGFFNVMPSEKWIATMKEISAQSSGDVDFPPALQWARRPIWFAPENMILFGMGIPFGLAAFGGFLLMGWRIITANWRKHILIWGWTGVYFTWQAVNWVRAMRYQVLIYPMFAIIAAWGIFALWEKGKLITRPKRAVFLRAAAIVVGTIAVAGTLIYAYAFTRIYNRTMTRIAASEWIYQNVPSAINLKINTGEDVTNQPLAFRGNRTISTEDPVDIIFTATSSGLLANIKLAHLIDSMNLPQIKNLQAEITDLNGNVLTTGQVSGDFPAGNDPRGNSVLIVLNIPLEIVEGNSYHLKLAVIEPGINLLASGPASLGLMSGSTISEVLLPDLVDGVSRDRPYVIQFSASNSGTIAEISLPKIMNSSNTSEQGKINVTFSVTPGGEDILGKSVVQIEFVGERIGKGQSAVAKFDPPVKVEKNKTYTLLFTTEDDTDVALMGNKPALESSWDDPLPLGMNNITPFDYNNGPYRTDLNFEMYWDDNQDKLTKFLSTLQQADYIFITSNRQWGTTTRVTERYPLTIAYYRNLLGCPVEKDILWCYRVAEPGMFTGNLGFELVKVFQSDPNIGDFRVNTQFAEEAFTVYDHPQVMIFKKQDSFDIKAVTKLLGSVDLSKVIHLTPHKAGSYQGDLTLPPDRLASQQAGGTWIELFNPASLLNQYPAAGAVVWYVLITLLGWITYPIMRIATKGLSDHGYGISKIVGLAVLAYFSWLAGSIGIEYNRLTILLVLLTLLLVSAILYFYQKEAIREDFHDLRKLFLGIEAVSLVLFLLFLGIRLGNPDLWHPYKGGEKPMDFSYFNAVLKSTSFPPYDPWYAGGYINYYYYGFVIVGTPVKLLGITPSVAYNLILPTLFSLVGTAAFSIGYTLIDALQNPQIQGFADSIRKRVLRTRLATEDPTVVLPSDVHDDEYESDRVETIQTGKPEAISIIQPHTQRSVFNPVAVLGGILSTLLLLILGNLGTIRMIWHGFIRIASPTGTLENSSYYDRIVWSVQGFIQMLQGAHFPYPVGEWYWIPSRTIPGEPITEFPFFTFLYADMHAHMIALPLTLAVLAWTLSMVLRNGQWRLEGEKVNAWVQMGICLFIGSLIVGALRPTNTWDLPLYLIIGALGILYSGFSGKDAQLVTNSKLTVWQRKLLESLIFLAGYIGLTFILYYPFSAWYGQGYNSVAIWEGTRTPSWSYFTHWGVFLVLILSWLVQETYDWMATTPVSALSRLKPYKGLIVGMAIILALIPIALVMSGVGIAWMAFPFAAWAGVLLLQPRLPSVKRFVLFLIGCAMVLTLAVELIVLVGDIGRMNTVFKFYLEAWTLLSLCSAFAFIQVFPRRIEWPNWLSSTWQVTIGVLICCSALFPILAGTDKIRDRISPAAPHTLDGAAYMASSTYDDDGVLIDLNQDYEAIQWMQKNVKGSPVIVEANTVEYRWGSRYTIYTGLPGVVGWNWHQRQQRAVIPSSTVTDRVEEIKHFYETVSREESLAFLEKYNVRYVIVGQLEYLHYPGDGLTKFQAYDGDLWNVVYQEGTTTIYQVNTKEKP